MTRRRWSPTEYELRQLLARHPTGEISFDQLGAELERDRRAVAGTIARMRRRGQLRVEPGRGRRPNRYQLVD